MKVASMTAMAMSQGLVSGRETLTLPTVSALAAKSFSLVSRAGVQPNASYEGWCR
jgi:hypothetical protein